MRKCYYIERREQDFWDNLWNDAGPDPEEMDRKSYPLFPAIEYIGKDGKVLECGCGPGRVFNYFYNNGFSVIGMDYSMSAVKSIKDSKAGASVVCSDALRLPFGPESFRYHCSFGVYGAFEEKEQRRSFLREAGRVLCEDGLLVASVSSKNHLFYGLSMLKQNSFMRRAFGRKPVKYCFGWYQFSRLEIKSEIEEEGFLVENIVPVNTKELFYDLFPFFRGKLSGFDRKEAFKLTRGSENVYPLNKMGTKALSFINKKFPDLMAVTYVVIARKRIK